MTTGFMERVGTAVWFDGATSLRRDVDVRLDGATLELVAPGDPAESRRYPSAALRVGEPSKTGPLAVGLPDGGSLWLGTRARDVAAALLRDARPRQPVARVIGSWPAVAACLVALIALLVWFDRQGAQVAAAAVIAVMPRAVDDAVGRAALRSISERWLHRTHLPPARRDEIRRRFGAIAARVAPGLDVTVQFHRAISDRGIGPGFNAFALPDGTLIVFDGLAEALDDDQLLAVLGHELGHVVHRHGMKAVARGIGLLVVGSMVFGDFSTIAATAVASVQTLRHSREAEREADAYARTVATAARLPPGTLASVWRTFAEHQGRDASGLPAWLSTHPSTEERLREAGRR